MPSKQASTPATTDPLDQLEALAKAATKGLWKIREHPRHPSFIQAPRAKPSDPYDIELLGEDDTLYPTRDADMAFIVAAQPAVVLELIKQLRHARRLHEML